MQCVNCLHFKIREVNLETAKELGFNSFKVKKEIRVNGGRCNIMYCSLFIARREVYIENRYSNYKHKGENKYKSELMETKCHKFDDMDK